MEKQEEHTASGNWPSGILVVEDDPVLLKFMGEALIMFGITPTLAGDGQEAIEKLKSACFPLVITDMRMSGVNGMQLIAHIKEHYPMTDIIVMTGYSKSYGLIDVILAGATDYINKPFTLDELKAKIKRVTRERALLQLLQEELARRRNFELDLSRQKKKLLDQVQQQKEELLETNAALRVILRQRHMEMEGLASTLKTRFVREIAPYLDKLNHSCLEESQRHCLDMITMNLENIFIPASQHVTFSHKPFTETETKVVNLVKQQKTSREIALLLQVTTGTIRTHRENIRKKLQITNTKKSLYKTILSVL